jgi:hypothetical protein
MIQNSVFEGKYRTASLENVSQALLGIGKYGKLSAGTFDILSLPIKEQIQYVKRDAELCMLLAQYNNYLALIVMKVIAKYSKMDYYQVCHTNVSHWYGFKTKRKIIQVVYITLYNIQGSDSYLNNEILVVIAIALALTLAAGLITTGTLGEPYHLAFAKKNSKVSPRIAIFNTGAKDTP